MEPSEHPPSVHVGVGPDGSLTYLVDLPPEELPPVHKRDLERAWHAARDAALAQRWGATRGFRFRRADGTHADLALADRDACCWAGAVDGTVGMRNSYGLSVCLRLLALVDLLARVRWADRPVPAATRRRGTGSRTAACRGNHATDPGRAVRRDRIPQPLGPVRLRLGAGGATAPRLTGATAMSRRLALLLPMLLALQQCAPPPPPVGQARADAATLAACREHADAVYDRQNRDSIYTINNRNTPYSANYTPRRGRSRPAATLRLRKHDTRLRAQHRHRRPTAPTRPSLPAARTRPALIRRSRPRWPACQQSAASWRSAMRGSSTAGSVTCWTGSWMQRVATDWLAWELTHSALWVSVIAFCNLAPSVIISPLAGAVADRMDRVRLTVASQFVAAGQAAILVMLILTGLIRVEFIAALAASTAWPRRSPSRPANACCPGWFRAPICRAPWR